MGKLATHTNTKIMELLLQMGKTCVWMMKFQAKLHPSCVPDLIKLDSTQTCQLCTWKEKTLLKRSLPCFFTDSSISTPTIPRLPPSRNPLNTFFFFFFVYKLTKLCSLLKLLFFCLKVQSQESECSAVFDLAYN